MIRDINKEEKIEFSQKCINNSFSFFWFWCFNIENLFNDVTFFMDSGLDDISLRAKIIVILYGIITIPLLFISCGLCYCCGIMYFTKVKDTYPICYKTARIIACIIIIIFFLIPCCFIRIPYSIYTFIIFKKNALINLLLID